MGIMAEKTMVISYADENYAENVEEDFLNSLRNKAGYTGKIVILNYGISQEAAERMKKKFDVTFVSFTKNLAVFSQRYRDIPTVIDTYCKDIENIILIDSGDVWFQKDIMPIFQATRKKVGCVEEKIVMGVDDWTYKCLANLSKEMQEKILDRCNGTHVKNSGMIAGPKSQIRKIVKAVYQDVLDAGIEYFGIDQLMFNYEFAMLDESEKAILDTQYNYVLITNKEGFLIKDDVIIRKEDNLAVTVVHNAGGAWRLLSRPFVNKYINNDQYILENVTLIETNGVTEAC